MSALNLVDSHCHLDFDDFGNDFASVLDRARENGVARMLTICTRVTKFDQVLKIAESADNIRCSVGIHPHEAANEPEVDVAKLAELARHPKVVGIGEAGLDYFYDKSPRERQQEVGKDDCRVNFDGPDGLQRDFYSQLGRLT